MKGLLQKLSLNSTIKKAILTHEGTMGAALKCVIEYEQGNWDYLMGFMANQYNIDTKAFMNAYIDALNWVEENAR